MDNVDYETRVQKYEQEGCTRSDAQGIVDAEDLTPAGPFGISRP